MFPTDKNQYDKPNGNNESKAETSTSETKETNIDKTGQDQIKELGNSEVISETIEQLNLIQNITNKELVNQKQEKARFTGQNRNQPHHQHQNVYSAFRDPNRSGYRETCTRTQRN